MTLEILAKKFFFWKQQVVTVKLNLKPGIIKTKIVSNVANLKLERESLDCIS